MRGRDPEGPVRVALLAPLPPSVLTDRFPDLEVATPPAGGTVQELAVTCEDARIVIADWSGRHRVTGPVVEVLSGSCELVQVPAAGLDSVDADALHAAGVPIASCAGLNQVAVAEWCIWAVLDALRQLSASDRALRAGRWEQLGRARFELAGRTVGIVGLGTIGTGVAERLAPFGTTVLYTGRHRRDDATERALGVRWADLDLLLATSDVVLLTCALTPRTRGLLDAERIARMRHGAVLVNAARGEVVDEAAVAAAVDDGRLHGVVTDVYTREPPPADHPLLGRETVTTTPHVGGASVESVTRIITRVFDNVEAVLEGRPPAGLVERPTP